MVIRQPEQGTVIEMETARKALVLSKNYFNQTGMCIVCPVVSKAGEDALHLKISVNGTEAYALCEHLKTIDLSARYFRMIGRISYSMIQEVSDTIQSLFDYYPYSLRQ